MQIPFVGPSYQARSLRVDAQRAVNCYVEIDQAGGKPLALYGTPGLTLRATLAGPHRGSIEFNGVAIVVSGNTVYSINAAYAATTLGTIGSGSGPVGMAANSEEVLIVDGLGGWLATPSSLTRISDVDFPTGVTSCGYLDGFFVVAGDGSGRLYCNETPNDGSGWNGLDFASAEGSPDNIVRLVVDHREIWLVGSKTTELYINTGNADFPFERNGSVFIEMGAVSPWSVASLDNALYMLGQDDQGSGVVYRIEGYTPKRISTHAVETALAGYVLTDAQAFTVQFHGHSFYVLNFPSSDHTWAYDAATGQWFEWLWRNPNTNIDHRHRACTHVYVNGKHLLGDWENGKLYSLEEDVYTDNGDPIRRLRASQTQESESRLMFHEELIVDMETGVGLETGQGSNPLLMLRYSNDSGRTWSNYQTRPIGEAGRYGTRVKYGPTGAGRNRVWEVSMTDPVPFVIVGAYVRTVAGY